MQVGLQPVTAYGHAVKVAHGFVRRLVHPELMTVKVVCLTLPEAQAIGFALGDLFHDQTPTTRLRWGRQWSRLAPMPCETARTPKCVRMPETFDRSRSDEMMTPLPKPRAMTAMVTYRSGEHNAKQMATLMEASRDTAVRVVELTEQVAALLDRVAALEPRG